MIARAVLLLALVWTAATAAGAQEHNYPSIAACFVADHGEGKDQTSCIGLTSEPCLATPEGMSTQGSAQCLNEETSAWDAILNEQYRKLMKAAPKKAADKLRQSQRAWIAVRDLDCSLDWDLLEGGSMAVTLSASCNLYRTAHRAIQLKNWLSLVE